MTDSTAPTLTPDSSAGAGLKEGIHRLARGAHSEITTVAEAAGPALDRVASGAHHAVDSADRMAGQAADALDALGVKGEDLAATGAGYVRAHPLLSFAIAVAAGYALSRLLTER